MSGELPGEGREHPRDPWRNTRVGEQGDPLLPRWFAILAVVIVPVGLVVGVVAFLNAGRGEVPVAERRPADADRFTSEVGALAAGDAEPQAFDAPCPVVAGIQVAGEQRDLAALRAGLSALCSGALPGEVVSPLRGFGAQAGVVRFAVFQRTAVDSTARPLRVRHLGDRSVRHQPVIYLNAKFSRTDTEWIAPLVAYEAVMLASQPKAVTSVLRAREAELTVCRTLGLEDATPGCRDAAELLALPDAAAALRAAGYR